ncbi:MAG TPA: hypothetical protein VMF67_09045 [Rhizomicrobium sp.]|nr:hypothetical protein [Rhizomicrobium sp.]
MEVGGTIYDCADAPAATLPDGNVLVQASPGTYEEPSHFWEFSISKTGTVTATQVNDPKEAPNDPSYFGNLLLLPTGQVLWDDSQDPTPEVSVYTPQGKAKKKWEPVVSSVSTTLTVGSTGNAISGTNFNGWDLGGTYGDDSQEATNWPIVKITTPARAMSATATAMTSRPWACGQPARPMPRSMFRAPARLVQARFRLSSTASRPRPSPSL